ncbi:MAG: hypothetical protein F6J97_18970 [Leptolyngbya sp. SIO4C1]|nr:hypothetical protein [Leptolyngbya sp. SIO4C1]
MATPGNADNIVRQTTQPSPSSTPQQSVAPSRQTTIPTGLNTSQPNSHSQAAIGGTSRDSRYERTRAAMLASEPGVVDQKAFQDMTPSPALTKRVSKINQAFKARDPKGYMGNSVREYRKEYARQCRAHGSRARAGDALTRQGTDADIAGRMLAAGFSQKQTAYAIYKASPHLANTKSRRDRLEHAKNMVGAAAANRNVHRQIDAVTRNKVARNVPATDRRLKENGAHTPAPKQQYGRSIADRRPQQATHTAARERTQTHGQRSQGIVRGTSRGPRH